MVWYGYRLRCVVLSKGNTSEFYKYGLSSNIVSNIVCKFSFTSEETVPEDNVEPDIANVSQTTSKVDASADLLPSWTECGVQYENRIVGGDLLDLDEFPWMALLIYNKNIR